jgi:hypothetical protein
VLRAGNGLNMLQPAIEKKAGIIQSSLKSPGLRAGAEWRGFIGLRNII